MDSLRFAIIISSTIMIYLNISAHFFLPKSKYDSMLDALHRSEYIPGYTNRDLDLNELAMLINKPLASFDLDFVNSTVFYSLRHSDIRRIEIHENWLLWLVSSFYEPLARTQNPALIVAGGNAICSEAAVVLNFIAELNGYRARFVRLGGHIVSEIEIDGELFVADPDFGLVFSHSYSELVSLDPELLTALVDEKLSQRGFGDDRIDLYLEILTSTANNVISDFGMALSPRLELIEMLSEVLKWGIPFALIVVCPTASGRVERMTNILERQRILLVARYSTDFGKANQGGSRWRVSLDSGASSSG